MWRASRRVEGIRTTRHSVCSHHSHQSNQREPNLQPHVSAWTAAPRPRRRRQAVPRPGRRGARGRTGPRRTGRAHWSIAGGRLVVGADDAQRILVGARVPGVGDVALAGRVRDQKEDEPTDDQQDQDGCDDITHTHAATQSHATVKRPVGLGSAGRMADELTGKKIAFLAAEGVEQVELTEPWKAVQQAGGTPELLSTEDGEVQAFNHLDKADTFTVDRTVASASASDYDGLVLPGGVANPDFLRADDDAVAFVRGVLRAGQAGRRDLPRAVDAGRGRRRPRAHADLLAVDQDRPRERGRDLGRRGGPRRRGPDELAQARRPAGLLRQDRRGVRRGQARRAGRERPR